MIPYIERVFQDYKGVFLSPVLTLEVLQAEGELADRGTVLSCRPWLHRSDQSCGTNQWKFFQTSFKWKFKCL